MLTVQEELPVLESFINIRNRLTALKKVSLTPTFLASVVLPYLLSAATSKMTPRVTQVLTRAIRTRPGSSAPKMS